MNIISTIEQLNNNIAELERGRRATNNELEKYRALIKRGTCFLAYESDIGIAFAPSRFIGYVENKLAHHANNPNRDGGVTNTAINQLLAVRPTANSALEQAYIEFCVEIGVLPSKTGSFGVERKYWITTSISELLKDSAEKEISQSSNLTETEKQQLIKARIGQGAFRESLIRIWGKCSITGCDCVSVLRASHIKPWRDSTNAERLDKFNGLLLTPNLDVLFDNGFISFLDSGEILISKSLSDNVCKALGVSADAKLQIKSGHAKYLKWHREKVFADAEA